MNKTESYDTEVMDEQITATQEQEWQNRICSHSGLAVANESLHEPCRSFLIEKLTTIHLVPLDLASASRTFKGFV